jgi:hypothetical protein
VNVMMFPLRPLCVSYKVVMPLHTEEGLHTSGKNFIFGRAVCVGNHYALMESVPVLTTIAQYFRLKPASNVPSAKRVVEGEHAKKGMIFFYNNR